MIDEAINLYFCCKSELHISINLDNNANSQMIFYYSYLILR